MVGSLNTDLVTYLEDVPQSGQTVFGRSFASGFGGKGSNQAVMAGICGARVFMVGCLGDDSNGVATKAHLDELGISSEFVTIAPTSSGVALIWVEASGANRIVIVSGANSYNTAEHAGSTIGQIDGLDVVVGQLEIPIQATLGGLKRAKKRGAVTILNPAPATNLPDELPPEVDWLVPNEHEFELIFDAEPTDAGIKAAAKRFLRSRNDNAQTVVEFGLVVTLGERGAAVYSVLTDSVDRVGVDAVRAVDTTGAGDAFVGAFAVAVASGFDPKRAALAGCLCATDSVKRTGAQESFPDSEFARQAFATASAG